MAQRSKRYRQSLEKFGARGPLDLESAVKLLKSAPATKFDQSVETAMHLGIDPKHADQTVRGAVRLPAGLGKKVRVLVFAKGENVEKAKQAGADYVGADDLASRIKEGWIDFDIALATPDMMGLVGPLGRVLGPRGLMPTPKNGTVTNDIASAVGEFKAGKIEYRSDDGGNVHAVVGKLSFSAEQLCDNIRAFVNHVRNSRPAAVKGTFIQSITISATMSPGIPVTV
jgi:large subunit ribosomal protein L1